MAERHQQLRYLLWKSELRLVGTQEAILVLLGPGLNQIRQRGGGLQP